MESDWQDYIFNRTVRIALPALVFAVVTGATVVFLYSRPVFFESSAKIWVQAKLPASTTNQQSAVFSPLISFFNSPIATAAEVMKSSVVLNDAIRDLKTTLPPSDIPTVDSLRKQMKVEPIRETDVLEISYQHKQPRVAYEVVHAIVNAFVRVNSTQSSGSAVQSRLFLQKQLAATKQQYQTVIKALKEFHESNNSVDVAQETEELLTQISTVKGELIDAQVEWTTARSRVKSLIGQLGMSPEAALAVDKISQDEVLHQLREKLADYQVRLVDTKGRFADDSLRVTRLKKSIERTEAAINERIRSVYGKLPITAYELPTGKEDKREKILDLLSTAQHDEAAAKQKTMELQSSLANLSAGLRRIPVEQATFSNLSRAEKVTSDSLSDAERNLSAAQLNETIAQEASNVQIIDLPEIAKKPESAGGRKIFAIVEALLLIFCAGLFYVLSYFDPHLYSAKKLSKLIPAPIAGWLDTNVFARSVTTIPVAHRLRLTVQDWVDSQPIAVLGPGTADGKTSVACGLALSYANSGKRVLLLDTNFANPSIHKVFTLPESPGLSDFVKSRNLVVLDKALKELEPNLFVITAGAADPNCIIEGPLLDILLNFAKSQADIIIFDTAAVDSSDSALALLSGTKKVLVVARLGHTRTSSIKALATSLSNKNVDSMVVLTNARESDVTAARARESNDERQPEMAAAW